MSTTTSTRTTPTRTTPTCDPLHAPSPRIRPPSSYVSYHSPDSRNHRSPNQNSPNQLASRHDVDPFLAQYIKPNALDFRQVYLSATKKYTHSKGYGYYQPYLRALKTPRARPISGVHKKNLRVGRVSPHQKPFYDENASESSLSGEEDEEDVPMDTPEVATRRRRHHSNVVASPAVPLKKPHPQVLVQHLPQEFMRCSRDDLVILIHRMLQSLINLNDRSIPESISNPQEGDPCRSEKKRKLLTRFHSRTPPAISIQTYLARLTKFNNFTQATLLTTIYYIDLLSHNYQPYFTLNSWTVHRFLLVATMLAQKALEDYFFTNDHYAKVGGVALTELNCLELDFLTRVGWKLVPAKQLDNNTTSIKYYKEVLQLYYEQLISLMGSNVSEHNNVVYTLAPAKHSVAASN